MTEDFYPHDKTPATQHSLSALEQAAAIRRLSLALQRIQRDRDMLKADSDRFRQERDDAREEARNLRGQVTFYQRSAQLRADAAESSRHHTPPPQVRLGFSASAVVAIGIGGALLGTFVTLLWLVVRTPS